MININTTINSIISQYKSVATAEVTDYLQSNQDSNKLTKKKLFFLLWIVVKKKHKVAYKKNIKCISVTLTKCGCHMFCM